MIAEVEAGNVGAVIVKDMSRFGRDYLKVGFYTEVMFKEKGVRFIAINNGIDSANQQDSDFTPFLNIMNEWYQLLPCQPPPHGTGGVLFFPTGKGFSRGQHRRPVPLYALSFPSEGMACGGAE